MSRGERLYSVRGKPNREVKSERQAPVDDAGLSEDYIDDGFGNTWNATCPCGGKMEIVRPGKAQCGRCG